MDYLKLTQRKVLVEVGVVCTVIYGSHGGNCLRVLPSGT